MRILLLLILGAVLLYYLSRRFFAPVAEGGSLARPDRHNNLLLVESGAAMTAKAGKATLLTVGIGIVLSILIFWIGFRIKIAWIALPLSLYLIGQLFVYSNHIKTLRGQRVFFDPSNSDILVNYTDGTQLYFNLLRDVTSVSEVKSVQANRGILFGYYVLHLQNQRLVLPYLLDRQDRTINTQLFATLNQNFRIEVERKLFPII